MKSLVTLLLVSILLFVAHAQISSEALWKKYTHEITGMLARNYCAHAKQPYPCKALDTTTFQLATVPIDASWHKTKSELSENVCKFAPAWSTEFRPLCSSASCFTTEAYANLLKSIPNASDGAMAFVKYQTRMNAIKAGSVDGGAWISENAHALQQFVNSMAGKINYETGFTLDKHTIAQFTSNPWGLKTPNLVRGDFVRSVDKTKAAALSDMAVFYNHYLQMYRQEAQASFEQSNNVQFSFSMKGIAAIDVAPNGWFNKTIVQEYASQMPQFFGQNGKFPLLPKTIYVAYQPKVEIIVDIKTIQGLSSSLDKNYITWLVGGFHFSHTSKHATALSDDDEISGDKITIEPFYDSPSEDAAMDTLADEIVEALVASDDDYEVNSDFARLLLQAVQKVIQQAKVDATANVTMQKYKVIMESRSENPQILGVVNEILPAF